MYRSYAGVCFALCSALWMVMNAAPVVALNDEGHVLLEFWNRIHDSSGGLSDWNAEHSTPCRWNGITCSKDFRVVVINLTGKLLEGNLTVDITRFSKLQALNLSSNAFSGEIPSSFGDSPSLEILDLSNNQLEGEIPTTLNSLANLSFLNVSFNDLQGIVPEGGSLALFPGESFIGNARLFDKARLRERQRFRSLVEIEVLSSACRPQVLEVLERAKLLMEKSSIVYRREDDNVPTFW